MEIAKEPLIKIIKCEYLFVLFTLFFVAYAVILLDLKFDTFRNWRYEYDLFSFDTAISETAKGNIGLDFEYGNTFGDHAYLFVLFIAPLKLFLGNRMIYLLLSLATIAYLLSALIFYVTVRRLTNKALAFYLSIPYAFGFTYILNGLHEKNWGMHPDTFSGFLLCAVTCLFMVRQMANVSIHARRWSTVGLVIALLAFLSLKEEMVLLAMVYFLIITVIKKDKNFLMMAAGAALLFGFDLLFISWFKTPYNRTNAKLFVDFFAFLQSPDLNFFNQRTGSQGVLSDYVAFYFMAGTLLLFIYLSLFRRPFNPFTLALYLTGLAKMFLGVFTFDIDLYGWHMFPGVVMMVCAILLQIALVWTSVPKAASGLALLLCLASMVTFVMVDLRQIDRLYYKNFDKHRRVQVVTNDLDDIRRRIDPRRVAGVPPFSSHYWIGHRFNYFDFTNTDLPDGIFDYIVIPLGEDAMSLSLVSKTPGPTDDIWQSFKEVYRNRNYILLQRYAVTAKDAEVRSFFTKYNLDPGLPPVLMP